MSNLIDRQAAIDAIYHHFPDKTREECAMVLHEVPSAQPADVVEVVRCKSCKYCREEDEFEHWCYGFCSPARLVREEDFCSYGKARD